MNSEKNAVLQRQVASSVLCHLVLVGLNTTAHRLTCHVSTPTAPDWHTLSLISRILSGEDYHSDYNCNTRLDAGLWKGQAALGLA
jgi:hypothetical protein